MNCKIIPLIFLLILFQVPVSNAKKNFDLDLEVSPRPDLNLLYPGESYSFKVLIENNETDIFPGQPIDPSEEIIKHTGNITISMELVWRVSGDYDFGSATTGYSFIPKRTEMNQTVSLFRTYPRYDLTFNYTFEEDGYLLGAKPFEEVKVSAKITAYYEAYNWTIGPELPFTGPAFEVKDFTYYLIDETKIDYLNGKYQEMEHEIGLLELLPRTMVMDRDDYYLILYDMNMSLNNADYREAADIWDRYNERQRTTLIRSLIKETNSSITKTIDYDELVINLELAEVNYESIENRYISLNQVYQTRISELEASKENLSTAITGVFLSAIVFFFIGQKIAERKSVLIEEPVDEGEMNDA